MTAKNSENEEFERREYIENRSVLGRNRKYTMLATEPDVYRAISTEQHAFMQFLSGGVLEKHFEATRQMHPSKSPLDWYELAVDATVNEYFGTDWGKIWKPEIYGDSVHVGEMIDEFRQGIGTMQMVLRDDIFGSEMPPNKMDFQKWEFNLAVFLENADKFVHHTGVPHKDPDGSETEYVVICAAINLGQYLVKEGYSLIANCIREQQDAQK